MAPIPTVATRIPVEPRTLVSPPPAEGETAAHARAPRITGAAATAAAAHPKTRKTPLLPASTRSCIPLPAFLRAATLILPPLTLRFSLRRIRVFYHCRPARAP